MSAKTIYVLCWIATIISSVFTLVIFVLMVMDILNKLGYGF